MAVSRSSQTTRSLQLEIPCDRISGVTSVNKFGRNAAVASGGTEEIWDGSRAYVFPTSASITHIRSAADSAITQGVTLEVQGLDTNWDLVIQTKATDGADSTTEVALDTALRRVFRVKVLDDTAMDQDLWVGPDPASAANSSAIVTAGNNQTLMAIYAVPLGKTAYITNYYATVNPGGGAPTTLNIKLWGVDNANGYAKQLKHMLGLNANAGAYGKFQHHFDPYLKFNAQWDVYLEATTAGAAADVSAGFDLILENN